VSIVADRPRSSLDDELHEIGSSLDELMKMTRDDLLAKANERQAQAAKHLEEARALSGSWRRSDSAQGRVKSAGTGAGASTIVAGVNKGPARTPRNAAPLMERWRL
jgi:hypothetical protein